MGTKLCKPCFNKNKNALQDGSVLDRVISQASSADQCLLYKLANYKKGGELIDAYNVGGQMEVEKLIKEQFGVLMYADGKGKIINRSEYLRWKFRDNDQVVLPIEAALSMHDPLAKWNDHEACWQMQYRGSLGESLLHVLIICDTKIHTKLARTLIKCFPKLAVDVVEGEEYLGASSLHLAIAYNNNELVQDLIGAGANVNQRAIGSFFLPRDQQRLQPAKTTDYEGLAYLGEYPLAWAACCANESVYNLLLDCGAHPDLQDHFGNMILHMVVVGDKLDMFGYALRHPKLPASNGIVNKAGLTPLTLACKLGRAEVFREMLELSAKEFWRYSNITCSAYPLNALDTLLPDGRTNWNSALFIILNGTKEEHLDMLDGGIIARLLEEKWKTFARNQFLKRLLILFIHLFFLSSAVYLRPTDPEEPLLAPIKDVFDIMRYGCEIGTVLGVLSYVVLQQGDEIKNQGIITFLKQQSHAPAKAIFLVSNLLILACIPCRLAGDQKTEEAILLIAVPGSWFLLMFFAGAVRLTGPFVTMIYSMITGDMLTFGIIYTVVLFGFSQSFFFLYKGYPNVSSTLFNSYASTWMALFQITLGDYNYSELAMTTYPVLSKSVFALFMVFVPILLLNMLIAMMGNTYAHVIEQSEKEWMKQWAKIVVTLEMAVKQSDAHHYLQEYSISLGPANDDPTVETRGVMVIKSKSKTRAKQRKGAVSNWKRVGKVTIAALRKRGLTGEELRCLMWGRESINTPIKIKKPKGELMNGLGGALTSALDVMTLTGDINIVEQPNNPMNINTTINTTTTTTMNTTVNTNSLLDKPTNPVPNGNRIENINAMSAFMNSSVSDAGSSMFGTLMNIANSPGIENNNKVPNQPPKQSKEQLNQVFDDPLRKLILLSDTNTSPEILYALALECANIPKEYEEQRDIPHRPISQMSIKNLTGLFHIKETCIKKIENSIKNKLQFLDHSESESLEMSILGKLSRTRRAKSISIRAASAKFKSNEKKGWNYLQHSDSSSSDNSMSANSRQMAKDEELDYAQERIARIKDSLLQEDFKNTDSSTMRPIFIDAAFGNDIADIKSTLLAENIVENEVENKTVLENNLKNKSKSKSRSKTAKANRIAPKCDVVQRRGASADQKKIEESSPPGYPESPPDYLEPWSVRGISNMNTILAWEAEPQSE